jgi:hypothetical protein
MVTMISVYRLGEMPVQSCGQSVSAPPRKAGVKLNAQTELRTNRQRSARESGRQAECQYRVEDTASALHAGSGIPKSAY